MRDRNGALPLYLGGDQVQNVLMDLVRRPCSECGRAVVPRPHEVDAKTFYCSNQCRSKARAWAISQRLAAAEGLDKDPPHMSHVLPRGMIAYTRRIVGGTTQSVAQIKCSKCRKPGVIPVSTRTHLPPDFILKKFLDIGWEHPARKRVLCPDCAHPAAKKKEEQLAMPIEAPVTTTQRAAAALVAAVAPPAPSPGGNSSKLPRELTPQEKRRVREKLDASFDEMRGYYLEGNSDDKIAAELNLPRAAVAKIREEGYGSIKGDPDVIELRTDLQHFGDNVKETLQGFAARLDSLEARFLGRQR